MKTELTIKDLCGYLPHGLKAVNLFKEKVEILGLTKENSSVNNDLWAFKQKGEFLWDYLYQCTPLLLPLSALAEPLEDGSIPIVELAKIANPGENMTNFQLRSKESIYGIRFIDNDCFYNVFSYQKEFNCFGQHVEYDEKTLTIVINQLQLFEYLYSKHFDIHGLIDAGLAYDKRTFKS